MDPHEQQAGLAAGQPAGAAPGAQPPAAPQPAPAVMGHAEVMQLIGQQVAPIQNVLNQLVEQMQNLAPFLQHQQEMAAVAAAGAQQAQQQAAAAAAAAVHADQEVHAVGHVAVEAEHAAEAAAAAAQAAQAAVLNAPAAVPHVAMPVSAEPQPAALVNVRVKSKFVVLSLATSTDGKEISGRLNQPLDSWRCAAELAFALNQVPGHLWVHTSIMNAMSGHVQAVSLSMINSGVITTWEELLTQLRINFEPHEQRRLAAGALESLQMRGDSVAALERYTAKSRELHIAAGTLVTEERKWEYFMRGLPEEIGLMLSAVIAATEAEHTFEAASKLALNMLGSRVRHMQPITSTQPATTTGPTPMDLAVNAMRNMGANKGEALNTLRRPGWWKGNSSSSGKPGGNRSKRQTTGKGPLPGNWKPKLRPRERKELMQQGKCLCCKVSTAHTWRDCPRNPDNRGNA